MRNFKPYLALFGVFFFLSLGTPTSAQCPLILSSDVIDHTMTLCEGDMLTMVATGEGFPPGSTLDWYLVEGSENPYNGEGELIASAPVTGDPCNNPPEILYVMVNPDNGQVGGSGDQCDEFLVLWTGSGGYNTSDIVISNLGPGSFQWDDYAAGNGANFSCGSPLPPGEVPEDAILIIQSSPDNNVFIDIDDLCASGLPVYIITYTGTIDCAGGYFDNNSPCSSCPIMVDIGGSGCQFDFELDYSPPGSSMDGWGWANTGSGVYADIVPALDIPDFIPEDQIIDDVSWTVPDNFCEDYTGSNYAILGIPNPPPQAPCLEVTTSLFSVEVGCGTIELIGGGDVCEGNCPDNPTEMIFNVTGNDFPFIVDIEVMVPIFGIFPIDGLEIIDGQKIFVCLEGFFPSFDPNTGILNVPILAIGFSTSVTIVSALTTSGCPVTLNQNSIELNFIEAPTANAGNDQTICAGETVDVSGSIGGSAVSSMWMTNGDGMFADPDALSTIYTPGADDIANGEVEITLVSMDVNGSCTPAESSFTIFINPSLEIDVNSPLTICDNDVATVIAMVTGGIADCLWETDGDGVFDDPTAETTIYTPGVLDIQAGSVTLYYNPVDPDACVFSNEPLLLSFASAPQVTVPQNLEICEGDSIVIEIDITGDYVAVAWTFTGDGDLVIEDDFTVTYTPGPMDINNQFFIISVSVTSSFPECGITTINIPINVALCDCPDFETMPPFAALCGLGDALDLDDLLVSGGAGNWSITDVPPGANPATLNGTVFTTNGSDPGVYSVTYTLSFPEPGCPATMTETIIVQEVLTPLAGNDVAFCGYQNVSVFGEVVPSSSNTILWETLGDGQFADPELLNTTYALGALDSQATSITLVLHVTDPICGDGTDTIVLFFNQPPVTTFVNDTVSVCNMPLNGSVINFNALITGGDNGGVWSNPFGVPVDFTDPGAVDFDGVAEGYYMFQYETNSALSPCSETVYTMIVSVEECTCPLLIVQNVPDGLCVSQPSLPLDAFVQAGGPGTWQIFSTPPGSNPATIMGSLMIIDGCDPGDYSVRFTFDAAPIDGCPDSAEINIFIQGLPLLSLSNDTSLCGEGIIQVQANINGTSTGVMWATTGTGIFDDPALLNPVYTVSANDVAAGLIYLIGTATDTFGFCPSPGDSIVVMLETPPFAVFSTLTDTLCIHPDSSSIINLSAFVVGGEANGIWDDLDGTLVDLNDPSQVDFDMVMPGSYRFSYTTQSAVAPCVDSSYIFTVVIEDCACPALEIMSAPIMLCQGDAFDLSDLIINAAPGQWSINTGPAGIWPEINGSSMTTVNAAGGNYSMMYTLNDSIANCPASAVIAMQLEVFPTYTITSISCDADHIIYEVTIETDASTLISDFGMVTSIGTDGFSIDSILSGQNIQVTLSGASGMCSTSFAVTAPDCDCTLFIEDIADTLRFCPGDTFVLIPFVTGAQGLPFSTWVTPYGTFMQPSLKLFQEGTYIWIVRDMAGCEERDTFTVEFSYPVLTEYTTAPPVCPNAGGQFILEEIYGIPPFVIGFDGGPGVLVDTFPYIIDDVSIGNHNISITDVTGCASNEFVEMYSFWDFGTVELGDDQTIPLGDSAFIQPMIEGIAVASVIWSPAMPGLGIEDFWFAPETNTLISVMVQDTMGCIYEDQLLITVFSKEKIYIPNIFSPNDDGINDVFEVVTNLPVENMLSLEIFDRWGDLVHAQYDALSFQWDGTTKDQNVQSGVYVYKFSWKNQKGETNVEVGDVTVIR